MSIFEILFMIIATIVAIDFAIRIIVFATTDDYETKCHTKHSHFWWMH